jgi:hypothetical protein
MDMLESSASSVEELDKVQKMRGYITNFEEDLYAKSSPRELATLSAMSARGELTAERLDESLANPDPDKRLSGKDYAVLLEQVQADRQGLPSTITWESWKERYDMQFPSPEKLSTTGMIVSFFGKSDPNAGLTPDELKKRQENETMKNKVFVTAKELIANGEIVNESQLSSWFGQEFAKASQNFGSVKVEGTSGKAVPEMAAINSSPQLKNLYDFYSTKDKNQLLLDVKNEKLSSEDAAIILGVLKLQGKYE